MLITFLAFLVVTGVVAGLGFGALRLPGTLADRRMERRLREVSHREDDARPTSFIRDKKAGPLPALDRALGGSSSLSRLVEQSGVATTPSTIVLASVGLAVLLGVATLFFVRQPFAWLAGGLAGMMLPYGFLKHRRNARMKRFEEQFPEALDLLSRALKAGHAFTTGLGMIAEEMPAPLGPEFQLLHDQQNFGMPLPDALKEFARRIPLLDARFFVTAVLIQREAGGNLAEILDNIATVIRDRFRVKRQIRVISAHGRLTGGVLVAVPPTLGAVLFFINPNHWATLLGSPLGLQLIGAAVVLQVTGTLIIRKLIRIEY